MIFLYIFIFIISCLILIRSGAWIVQALTRIARFLRWKEFIVASLLMAFTTSLPELFFAISSALHKKPELYFSNVIGSNIIVLTLIIGGGTLIAKKLRFQGKTLQQSSLYSPLIAVLPLLLILDKNLSRVDGIILIFVSFLYLYWLLYKKARFTEVFLKRIKNGKVNFGLFLKDLAVFFIGISLLLISSEGLVWSTLNLAGELKIPLLIIGFFLAALGTSIPEITFGIKALKTNHKDMILGDAIGSVVVNSTLVLGIGVLIFPFEVPNLSPYSVGIIFTAITALFFAIFART